LCERERKREKAMWEVEKGRKVMRERKGESEREREKGYIWEVGLKGGHER
jgi:hypothetical protein